MPRARAKPAAPLPEFIKPQLAELVTEAPDGPEWLHEIKFDGYRIVARIEGGAARLFTRSGLDWTHKYAATAAALSALRRNRSPRSGLLPCGRSRTKVRPA